MEMSYTYWSNKIRTVAEEKGWVAKNEIQPMYYFGWILKTHELDEWAHEQIFSALTKEDPEVAQRALVAAKRTLGQMEQRGIPHDLFDAYHAAEQRVEEMFS